LYLVDERHVLPSTANNPYRLNIAAWLRRTG